MPGEVQVKLISPRAKFEFFFDPLIFPPLYDRCFCLRAYGRVGVAAPAVSYLCDPDVATRGLIDGHKIPRWLSD